MGKERDMKDTYTYRIGDNLYVNLTNRCTNRCTFCVREQSGEYEGYSLWLRGGEPCAGQVIAEIGDPRRYREIVFCGYGEPTYRLAAMLEIGEYVVSRGGKTRLNTNGHGNAINGRNVAPELAGKICGVNISLNAPTAARYAAVCRPQIANAFCETVGFARRCKEAGVPCWFSVVDCIGQEEVAACKKIAEEAGVPLRVREYIG